MKVKICGLTNIEDAFMVAEAGADLLGFNFYARSLRHILPEQCARLTAAVASFRPAITLVGVFVNATARQIDLTLKECNLDLAQLSGNEPAETLRYLGQRAFKSLRPADGPGLSKLEQEYPPHYGPPAYLVDAYRLGKYGGTGQTANWSLAACLAAQFPILLAGGLNPNNVAAAVSQVRPWGVDVASGVEKSPGIKDPFKVREFISAARNGFEP